MDTAQQNIRETQKVNIYHHLSQNSSPAKISKTNKLSLLQKRNFQFAKL